MICHRKPAVFATLCHQSSPHLAHLVFYRRDPSMSSLYWGSNIKLVFLLSAVLQRNLNIGQSQTLSVREPRPPRGHHVITHTWTGLSAPNTREHMLGNPCRGKKCLHQI